MPKIPSGIREIDRAIGGLEAKQVFLLTGGTGTAKTALSLLFLAEGLRNGESALLVTSDFPDDVFDFASEFLGVDFRAEIEQGKFTLLDYPMAVEEFRNPVLDFDIEDVVGELAQHCQEIGASRVVIDSLSPLLVFSANRDPLDFARGLILGLKGIGATILATGDVEGEATTAEVFRALERLAHGAFELKMVPGVAMGAVRSFTVKKIKGEMPEKTTLYFTLRSGVGAVFMEEPPPPQAYEVVPETRPVPQVVAAAQEPEFALQLAREMSRATRYSRPLSLVVLSIENFKIRRSAGPEGQEFISLFQRVLSETSRDTDVISRYAWDRFIALLPETTAPNANRFVRRVTANLENALAKEGLYRGEQVPPLKAGVAEQPGDTSEGEELLSVALRRLK